MSFHKPNTYDTATVLPENASYETIPNGGYILRIVDVHDKQSKNGNQYLEFDLDIAEGEYIGYYADDYKNRGGYDSSSNSQYPVKWRLTYKLIVPPERDPKPYTVQLFKSINTYLAESNRGFRFNWDLDETQYKNLFIGGLINKKEYLKKDNTVGEVVNVAKLVTTTTIRSGAYTVPNDVKLKSTETTQEIFKASSNDSVFMDVPDNVNDEDLPFN